MACQLKASLNALKHVGFRFFITMVWCRRGEIEFYIEFFILYEFISPLNVQLKLVVWNSYHILSLLSCSASPSIPLISLYTICLQGHWCQFQASCIPVTEKTLVETTLPFYNHYYQVLCITNTRERHLQDVIHFPWPDKSFSFIIIDEEPSISVNPFGWEASKAQTDL